MTLDRAKKIVQTGFAWANWTSEQKEAFRALLLEVEKVSQLKNENDILTQLLQENADKQDLLIHLPCKQHTTVYYIVNKRVHVGSYLAKVGKTTHIVLQDRLELAVCWVTDDALFFTQDAAEHAVSTQSSAT